MRLKATFVIVLTVCFFAEVNAQTAQGSFMVGGSMSLERYNREDPNGFAGQYPQGSFSISPTVGFFAINKLMVAVQPSYTYTWALGAPNKSRAMGIGPLVRYYFPFGKFAIFPEVSALLSKVKYTFTYIDPNTNSVGVMDINQKNKVVRGGVGAAWFVSPTIGVELIGYYRSSKISGDFAEMQKRSQVGFNFGIQFYIPSNTK